MILDSTDLSIRGPEAQVAGGVGLRSPLACGFLQETSPLMAQKRALLEAVAYNLLVFLTLPLPLPWTLKVFFPRPLGCKTNPSGGVNPDPLGIPLDR